MNQPLNIIPQSLDEQVPDVAKAVNNGGVWPNFFYRPIPNKIKSEEAGRTIHDQVAWVEIIVAGDRNSKVSRKVRPLEDQARWPAQYAAFKNGDKMPLQGTPLEQWSQLGVDQVADLKSLGILTVDMLAKLSDDQVQNYGLGGHQLREKAQAFIETAADQAVPQHLASENERLREDNISLTSQLESMQESMDENKPTADPEEVAELKTQITQNKMVIDTQTTALESQKALIVELRLKIDELKQASGVLVAENKKLKKKPSEKDKPE